MDRKTKDVFKSTPLLLQDALLPNIKYFGYNIVVQSNNTPLVVEQNTYVIKILNAYMFDDLGNWPTISLRNFKIKNCLFDATKIIKKVIKVSTCVLALG